MLAQNKIAVVTGGSRGIGKNMVLNPAKNGLDIVFSYNNQKEAAEEVVKQIEKLGQKGIALKLNVSDSSGFDDFKKTLISALQSQLNADGFDFLISRFYPLYSI